MIWLMFHQILPKYPVFLVAYPLPICYYKDKETSYIFYKGDNSKYEAMTSLCGEVLLLREETLVKYINP
jgi:hypothetical protein